jgi:hypothetical protein
MVVPAFFANFIVLENLLVAGDAAATFANVVVNEQNIRIAIASFGVVLVLDVIVAWALYVFFRPVNRDLSLLMAWFRLAYTAVFAAAIFNLLNVLSHATSTGGMGSELQQAGVMSSLNAFNNGWAFSLLIFGIHLVLLGYLAYESNIMPKILGILVIVAGLGYLIDSIAGILFPGLGVSVGLFTAIGEMLLALWLVFKGVNRKAWQEIEPVSA